MGIVLNQLASGKLTLGNYHNFCVRANWCIRKSLKAIILKFVSETSIHCRHDLKATLSAVVFAWKCLQEFYFPVEMCYANVVVHLVLHWKPRSEKETPSTNAAQRQIPRRHSKAVLSLYLITPLLTSRCCWLSDAKHKHQWIVFFQDFIRVVLATVPVLL